MFSEEFAQKVLESADLAAGSAVLDPWLGVGTTTRAASSLGHRAIGVDINPVMAMLARGRCVSRDGALAALETAEELVGSMKARTPDPNDPLSLWFSPPVIRTIRKWRDAAQEIGRRKGTAQEGFVLTALFEAAWELASGYRSKNPTRVKVPMVASRVTDRSDVFTRRVISRAHAKRSYADQVGRNTSQASCLEALQTSI